MKLNQSLAVIIAALITGVVGVGLAGYFQIRQTQIPIEATQTAEAKQTAEARQGSEVSQRPEPLITPATSIEKPIPELPSSSQTPTIEPTDTPQPSTLTPTPKPTNTPRPTPTPTATMDADPTVYDNFNNPAFDGSFNKSQWAVFNDSMGQVIQKDGMLIVSYDGKAPNDELGLTALKYSSAVQSPTFFEAKLMVDKPPQDGWVYLYLGADVPTGDYSDCTLGYGDTKAWISCGYVYQGGSGFRPSNQPVDYGTWHTARIEIEPSTMTFTYYIDGQVFGSYISPNAKELKKTKFGLRIGVYAPSAKHLTGYIDDVRIGPIGQ